MYTPFAIVDLCVFLYAGLAFGSASYLSSMASHCSCHFASFHAQMTAKLNSCRDPGAGLSEHAQCGGLEDLTSECGRQHTAAAGVSCADACTQQQLFSY